MALIDQIDKIACGVGDALGTGHQACPIDWDRISTVKLTKRNALFTDIDNLVNVKLAQQKGDVVIINNIDKFALVPVDLNIDTTEGSGKKTVSGEMPYEYELMFKSQGINFWKAMRSLDSAGVYDVTFYDVEGNEFFTKTKAGGLKGFGSYMIKTYQYKGKEGNSPSEFKTMIQLSDFKEMERMTYIASEELDYSAASDLDGVNDVLFTAQPLLVAGTALTVKTTLLDKSHFVEGLVTANFRVKRNGVLVTHTAAVADSGALTYALTIPAAVAGTYTVETWDAALGKSTIQTALGLLFKSNIATVIVV
jgi:hypothetical protein